MYSTRVQNKDVLDGSGCMASLLPGRPMATGLVLACKYHLQTPKIQVCQVVQIREPGWTRDDWQVRVITKCWQGICTGHFHACGQCLMTSLEPHYSHHDTGADFVVDCWVRAVVQGISARMAKRRCNCQKASLRTTSQRYMIVNMSASEFRLARNRLCAALLSCTGVKATRLSSCYM